MKRVAILRLMTASVLVATVAGACGDGSQAPGRDSGAGGSAVGSGAGGIAGGTGAGGAAGVGGSAGGGSGGASAGAGGIGGVTGGAGGGAGGAGAGMGGRGGLGGAPPWLPAGVVDTRGATIGDELGDVRLEIPPGALLGDTTFAITALADLSVLPPDYTAIAGTT